MVLKVLIGELTLLCRGIEGNKSYVFVDGSGFVAPVMQRNFYSEVEHSNLCQIAFILIKIVFVLINMPL